MGNVIYDRLFTIFIYFKVFPFISKTEKLTKTIRDDFKQQNTVGWEVV